jgi:hypothetical protein
MATRNSSEVERRRSRVRGKRTQTRPPTRPSPTAAGSLRPRGSAKRSHPSPRSPTRRRPSSPAAPPVMPLEVQKAIEDQRGELATAMTLLHCLHCALRREVDHAGPDESDEVEGAVGWVELPDLTAMLLVRLHAIHLALDSVSLRQALQASRP